MAETMLTRTQALDRATSGQVIAPDSKRQAQVRASMGMAVNVLARQAALKEAKRQLSAQGLRPSLTPRSLWRTNSRSAAAIRANWCLWSKPSRTISVASQSRPQRTLATAADPISKRS